jgi:hypothetical protein
LDHTVEEGFVMPASRAAIVVEPTPEALLGRLLGPPPTLPPLGG